MKEQGGTRADMLFTEAKDMEKSLKFGAGIGSKCSGGWRSNTN